MAVIFVLAIIYVIIFLTSVCGNSILISSVIRNNYLHKPVYYFLANVSISDLLFTILSLADAVYFLVGEWVFKEAFCRIQGAFVEITFTISMLSFGVIAAERYMSICLMSKRKLTLAFCVKINIAIWVISILVCSPLFYGYRTYTELESRSDVFVNVTLCTVNNWSMDVGIIYYGIHTVLAYLIPLGIMIYTHTKISKTLRDSENLKIYIRPDNTSALNQNSSVTTARDRVYTDTVGRLQDEKMAAKRARNQKVIKLCIVVTSVFFVIWTPYIIVRMVWHTDLYLPEVLWKLIQLLILSSTAVNFFIYAVMSPILRGAFWSALRCKSVGNQSSQINSTAS